MSNERIVDVMHGSIWGLKPPERKTSMGMFKELDIFIQQHSKCADDCKYYTNEIDQHLSGVLTYEDLSDTAKIIWAEYEEYMHDPDNMHGR